MSKKDDDSIVKNERQGKDRPIHTPEPKHERFREGVSHKDSIDQRPYHGRIVTRGKGDTDPPTPNPSPEEK